MRVARIFILVIAALVGTRLLAEPPSGVAPAESAATTGDPLVPVPEPTPADSRAEPIKTGPEAVRSEQERRRNDTLKRLTIIRKYKTLTDDEAQLSPPVVEAEVLPHPARRILDVEDDVIVAHAEEPTERFWFSASYLIWWIKAVDLPPLLTTGPTSDPTQPMDNQRPGALDSIYTMIRFGGTEIESHDRHGGRFGFGYWLDPDHRQAIEVTGFFLGDRKLSFLQASPGSPVLARPFFDTFNNQESAQLITYPGIALGSIRFSGSTALHGVEGNFLYVLRDDGLLGFDVLGGVRYLDLEESLVINETSQVLPGARDQNGDPSPLAGNTINTVDDFSTRNDFFGGQIGVRTRYHLRRLEVLLSGKVAFGDCYEVVRIAGSTRFGANPSTNANAGFLALPSNSGQFSRHTFAVVPEANAQISFQLFKRLRMFAGYSYLYLNDVVRPGDQIDLRINPNQLPGNTNPMAGGGNDPQFRFRSGNFWVQGGNFGLEFRY